MSRTRAVGQEMSLQRGAQGVAVRARRNLHPHKAADDAAAAASSVTRAELTALIADAARGTSRARRVLPVSVKGSANAGVHCGQPTAITWRTSAQRSQRAGRVACDRTSIIRGQRHTALWPTSCSRRQRRARPSARPHWGAILNSPVLVRHRCNRQSRSKS